MAQPRDLDIERAIVDHFAKKTAVGSEIPPVDEQLLLANPERSLAVLSRFEGSESPPDRVDALGMVWLLGRGSEDRLLRGEVASRLVRGCTDPAEEVSQHACIWVSDLEDRDFTEQSREVLRGALAKEDSRDELLLVIGSAGMREEIPRLRAIAAMGMDGPPRSAMWFGSKTWYASLALARLGSEGDTLSVVDAVRAEKNAVTRVGRLLPFLAYTRQPEAIRYIADFLYSEERMPAVKPTDQGVAFSQYALEALAKHSPNFPVRQKYVGGYSPADLAAAKQWVEAFNKDANHR